MFYAVIFFHNVQDVFEAPAQWRTEETDTENILVLLNGCVFITAVQPHSIIL